MSSEAAASLTLRAGDADDCGESGDVLDHYGAGPDDRLAAQGDFGDDRRANADERAGFDLDAPGDAHTWTNVAALADHRLIIDDAASI